jgi:cytochrome c peroxidase
MRRLAKGHPTRWVAAITSVLVTLAAFSLYQWQSFQGPGQAQPAQASRAPELRPEPIEPIPLSNKLDQKKVELGRLLFHDPQLSQNNTIACATCHDLQRGGTDRRARSMGINGSIGRLNAPTVFNSGFNFRQFWDGRAPSLEEQIAGPIHNPIEMGSNWPEVIAKLSKSPAYMSAFAQLYPDRLTSTNIQDAIATFERSLYTPNSRFDKFLRGDDDSISAEEKEGYRLFKAYGCVSCHQGVNVGGNMFQKMGVAVPYFGPQASITDVDLGRFRVTGDERDRHVFKVPSLRNVALTAPYFHDGSAHTLEDAVALMGLHQLGRELPKHDIDLLTRFLGTLTGEYNGAPLQ